jgi:hypothetical protein
VHGRRRLLHALGWTVVSIPFYDYYRLTTLRAKARLLCISLMLFASDSNVK